MSEFDEIEILFSKLLLEMHSLLSEHELDEVREFFDVGEYGLALQTAADIFKETSKTPTPNVMLLMTQLADAMSIDLEF